MKTLAPSLAVVLLVTSACGGDAGSESASAAGASPGAPAEGAASAPNAPAAAPTPPAAATGCTLGERVTVSEGRGSPRVIIGASQVAIVDRARRRVSVENGVCDVPSQVRFAPLDLSAFTARPATAPCIAADPSLGEEATPTPNLGGVLFTDVERAGDRLYLAECVLAGRDDTDASQDALCSVGPLAAATGAPASVRVEFVFIDDTRFGFRADALEGLDALTLAVGNIEDGGGVFAFLGTPTGLRATPRLGRPPTAMDLDDPLHFALGARLDATGNVVVDHGAATQTRRLRSVVSRDGRVVAFPASATLDAPEVVALGTATERVRGQPSAIRLVSNGVQAPIAGLDATVASFGSDSVALGERLLVVYSEGTGRSTRIRATLVDPSARAVVGPFVEVSEAGNEAGYATVDSFGGRTIVSWDEKVGGTWRVRAAPLVCR